METDLQRTGRWTTEEIAFVDFLLNAFDRGMLTLPHGIKLNEFLGDVLLCKSSRLTKKMKNARLSTRSYELRPPLANSEAMDCVAMSQLQEKFLQSLSSEPTQLELLFNLTKLWRTHFSNLCLQVGYSFIDARDWVSSLEAMERRASEAEELIRKARRKRMGLALKTDVRSSNPGVFFADRPVEGKDNTIFPKSRTSSMCSIGPPAPTPSATMPPPSLDLSRDMFNDPHEPSICSGSDESSDADFIAHMLELSSQPGPDGQRNRLLSMDLGPSGLDDYLFDSEEPQPPNQQAQPPQRMVPQQEPGVFDNGPFLKEIISFLEKNHLPFLHVDVWVPSYISDASDDGSGAGEGTAGGDGQLRLYNAGYATRNDINPAIAAQFNEFGEYSRKFSFAPGIGLPGRVFSQEQSEWCSRVDLTDPKMFERSGGARIYGVKSVVGIPLSSSIGKLVIGLYTMADIQRNDALIQKCAAAFSSYLPEPKWRLIVEMGSKGNNAATMNNNGPGTTVDLPADIDFSSCFENMDDFGGLASSAKPAAAAPAPASASQGTASSEAHTAEEEHKIATLLGEYMPLSHSSSSGGESSASSMGAPSFLSEFMQLRLLLLRPRSRRASLDNELIDVLLSSFRGYSSGNRRNGSELAMLLVKDWRFLKGASSSPNTLPKALPSAELSKPPAKANSTEYQCHVMEAPNVTTYAVQGMPTRAPSSLDFSAQRRSSYDAGNISSQQRRISILSEAPDSPPRSTQVNLVNEGY